MWENAIIMTRKQVILLFFQFAELFIATRQTSTEQKNPKVNSVHVFGLVLIFFFFLMRWNSKKIGNLKWLDSVGYYIGFKWQGFGNRGYKGGFCGKMPESAPISNRASAS